MRRLLGTLTFSIAVVLSSATTLAESAAPFSAAVPLLDKPPSMNGTVDATWAKAVQLPVLFDFTYQRDGQPTTVYVAQDSSALDLAFVVTQTTSITESTETNGAGVMSDDFVGVELWPQGAGGFSYFFIANARGARYQTSSENSAYAPDWTAVARRTPQGYTVTMRIPFNVVRSGGSKTWGAQFERGIQATNSMQVWEHVQAQRNAADRQYPGTLTGLGVSSAAKARPQPRLQLYALGEATTPQNGGSTSRLGGDLALPVTATSSFLASFHPDYSNVEVDQQTISPSAFARHYSEVRPFFTQLNSAYNNAFSCNNCPLTLYSPAIPTFREGYAYEGTQGPLNFAAFDAVGYGRSDNAEAVTYSVQDATKVLGISAQRVGVDLGGASDNTTSVYTGYEFAKSRDFIYYNAAQDRGTFVTDPGFADYQEYGAGHVDKNGVYGISYQKLGPQFQPADGFVQQPDVQGYQAFVNHTFYFKPHKALQDLFFSGFLNEQNDHRGNPAFRAFIGQINFDLPNQLTVHIFEGEDKNETLYNGEFLPFNQNGAFIGYKTQTSTPSSIMYMAGSYFHGSLRSWSYISTLPVTAKIKLSFEGDENLYAPLGAYAAVEPGARQWLERASVDWQFNRFASFDIGGRRIIGRNLPNAYQPPDTAPYNCGGAGPYCPFDYVGASNVSAAFHFLAAHNEWYVVYGNPNNLSTLPAFYIKWIRYFGAEKGT